MVRVRKSWMNWKGNRRKRRITRIGMILVVVRKRNPNKIKRGILRLMRRRMRHP